MSECIIKEMETAIQKLSAYSKIAVWVLKDNERAIRFMRDTVFVSMAQSKKLCSAHRIRNCE